MALDIRYNTVNLLVIRFILENSQQSLDLFRKS